MASGLTWRIERASREFEIDLFFNRTFVVSTTYEHDASWTRGDETRLLLAHPATNSDAETH